MRKIAFASAVIAAAAAPMAAVAGPGYTYLGAGYGALDPDGGSRLDGFAVEGSVAIQDDIHLMADFIRGKDSPVTAHRTRVAVGYNTPINPRADFVARAGWSFGKVKVSNVGSNSDDGFLGQLGVRGMATEELELNAFLTYDDVESKMSVEIGGLFNFTPNVGVTAGYSYSSDLETYKIGLRYTF